MTDRRKKIFRLIVLFFLVLVVAALWQLSRMLPVASGFAAKNMCSGLWVSGRDSAAVKAIDIHFFPVYLSKEKIDWEQKSVSSSILGLFTQKAIYRKGLGCCLVPQDGALYTSQLNPTEGLDSGRAERYWPLGDLIATDDSLDYDREKLELIMNKQFVRSIENPLHSRALLISYRGHLIAEQYDEGFGINSPQIGWSMSKSVTNALIGILVQQGKLRLDQAHLLPEWEHDERRNIRLQQLLQMQSGLEWEEDYGSLSPCTQMLYLEKDMGSYAASLPLAHEAGSYWQYSSGTTNILSKIIRNCFSSEREYLEFPYRYLFQPLGMHHALFETDASGTFVGSSYLYASARDWARFGLLFLNDGVYNGQRILPEGWVQMSTTAAAHSDCSVYGAQLWLNNPNCQSEEVNTYPDAPAEMYYFDGYRGQFVLIIPSKELVIVRLGFSKKYDVNGLVKEVMAILP